jgi:hypothetical protein
MAMTGLRPVAATKSGIVTQKNVGIPEFCGKVLELHMPKGYYIRGVYGLMIGQVFRFLMSTPIPLESVSVMFEG